MTEDGKVILNLASVDDLRHLPGVGLKRADAIWRCALGSDASSKSMTCYE